MISRGARVASPAARPLLAATAIALFFGCVYGCSSSRSQGEPWTESGVGEWGKPCSGPADCLSLTCATVSGRGRVCSESCASDANCLPGWTCSTGGAAAVCTCTPTSEICNGKDDDCNGVIDDPAPANAQCGAGGVGQTCVAGKCECPPTNSCGGACVDTQTDPTNCGGCGVACAVGRVCRTGACACPGSTQKDCASGCVDVSSDLQNCGACGNACATGQVCKSGTCGCASSGQQYCGSGCVDVASNAQNCGSCGNVCPSGQQCVAGTCNACPSGQASCGGVCVDVTSSTQNCGQCGRVCTQCSAGHCLTKLATVSGTSNIATDGTDVYFAGSSGLLSRVPVSGGTVTSYSTSETPGAIALDATNVYWVYNTGGTAQFRKLAKSAATGTAPTVLGSTQGTLYSLAIDGTNLYFASNVGIMKLPLAGGTPALLVSGAYQPSLGIAVDGTRIAWSAFNGNAVYIAPLTGGSATVVASGQMQVGGVAMDASYVYWATQGVLKRAPRAGGTATTLATQSSGTYGPVVVDATRAYYATDTQVLSVPLAGGTPVVLATGQTQPFFMAQDTTALYWVSAGGGYLTRVTKD